MNKLRSLTLNQARVLKCALFAVDFEDEGNSSDVEYLLDQLNDIIIYLEGKN